jgi:hypothetical protein
VSQSKTIFIPNEFTADQREEIGEDIVFHIRQRTESGLSVNNRPFAGYSKNYEKTGTVDLRFSGDMMADLEVLSHGPGFIKIGFTDSSSDEKAEWIQKPTGQKAGKQPPREFVGIAAKDLNRILDRYR